MFDPFEEDDVDVDVRSDPFAEYDARNKNKKTLWQRFVSWRVEKREARAAATSARIAEQRERIRGRAPPPPPRPNLSKQIRKLREYDPRNMTVTVNGKQVPAEQLTDDVESVIDKAMRQLDKSMERIDSDIDRSMKGLDDQMEALDVRLNGIVGQHLKGQKLYRRRSKESERARELIKQYNKKNRRGNTKPPQR